VTESLKKVLKNGANSTNENSIPPLLPVRRPDNQGKIPEK